MRTLKLTLAYDGTNYVGWQRQLNGVSIQQLVEEACAPVAGTTPAVAGAGRTDAGVHAFGQVASVEMDTSLPAASLQRAINFRLPVDIRVVDLADAPPDFHARFQAVGKTYRYRLVNNAVLLPFDRWFVWHVPEVRDIEAMRRAATVLLGRHDFSSFQAVGPSVRDPVKTIHRLEIQQVDGEVWIEVEGDGFLRHMVRTIVGSLADVGTGTRTSAWVADVLAARTRSAAGQTAPACGLTLISVQYC